MTSLIKRIESGTTPKTNLLAMASMLIGAGLVQILNSLTPLGRDAYILGIIELFGGFVAIYLAIQEPLGDKKTMEAQKK